MNHNQTEEFSEQRIADLFAEFEDSIEDPEEEPTEEPTAESDEEPAEEAVEEETEEAAEAPAEEEADGEEAEIPTDDNSPEEETPGEGDGNEEPRATVEVQEAPAVTEQSAYDRQSAADLAEIREAFPELAPGRLEEMEGYGKFIGMRMAGFSAIEAFGALRKQKNKAGAAAPAEGSGSSSVNTPAPLPKEAPPSAPASPSAPSKGHLTSVAPRTVGGATGMTREEMRAAREIFPGLSDREIAALHRKVNK